MKTDVSEYNYIKNEKNNTVLGRFPQINVE